jgi:hypothetical protein
MAGKPTTHEKALRINVDAAKYGIFAEIGAGQEVARWFFRVGGAAGTVAKTVSAYDTAVSDFLYGPTDRYVSRQRLQAMLEREYTILVEGLGPRRGDRSAFFALADTVATRSYSRHENGTCTDSSSTTGTSKLSIAMIPRFFRSVPTMCWVVCCAAIPVGSRLFRSVWRPSSRNGGSSGVTPRDGTESAMKPWWESVVLAGELHRPALVLPEKRLVNSG